MQRFNGYWAVALVILVATLAGSALVYPALPETIPTHWNLKGEADGFGSKTWAVFLLPLTTVGFLVFFWFLPALSPKNFEVDTFRTTYLYVMVATVGLFSYLHAVTLYAAWRHVQDPRQGFDLGRALVGGIFLFLALIGNVMGKIRRNFYIGVRVPWTLASDRVWNDTHRLAAWTMVGGSLIGLAIVAFGLALPLAIVVLAASALIPVVYSFVHYKQLERRGTL